MIKKCFSWIVCIFWALGLTTSNRAQAFVLANSVGHPVLVFASVQGERISTSTGLKAIHHFPLITFKNLDSGSFFAVEITPEVQPSDEIHIRIYDPTKTSEINEIRKLRAKAQEAMNIPVDNELRSRLTEFVLVKAKAPRQALRHSSAIQIKKVGNQYVLN